MTGGQHRSSGISQVPDDPAVLAENPPIHGETRSLVHSCPSRVRTPWHKRAPEQLGDFSDPRCYSWYTSARFGTRRDSVGEHR